jgi:hypothetical protein
MKKALPPTTAKELSNSGNYNTTSKAVTITKELAHAAYKALLTLNLNTVITQVLITLLSLLAGYLMGGV